MTLQKQLAFLAMMTCLALGLTILITWFNLNEMRHYYEQAQQDSAQIEQLKHIKLSIFEVAHEDLMLPATPKKLETAHQTVQKGLGTIKHTHTAKLLESWGEYYKGFSAALKMAETAPQDAMSLPDALYKQWMTPFLKQLDEIEEELHLKEQVSKQKMDAQIQKILLSVLIPLLIGALLIVILQVLFGHRLKVQMHGVLEKTSLLSQGDLSIALPHHHKNEIGMISSGINGCVTSLRKMIQTVQMASSSIYNQTGEMKKSTQAIAERAELQTLQVIEASDDMEEVNRSIAEIADSAGQAAQAAERAHALSEEGQQSGQLMERALEKLSADLNQVKVRIESLSTSLGRIGDVSELIQDIAGQTNLLALNAAIEAARAGDAGRGFAVVADEVRKLSDRTRNATGEINSSLQHIISESDQTVECIGMASEAMYSATDSGQRMQRRLSAVREAISEVSIMMQEIATATDEQSIGQREIQKMIEQMSENSQQSAETIQQADAFMVQLVRVAEELKEETLVFKLV